VQERDTTAVEVTSKVVHHHGANPKGGTPTASVATLVAQSVAVTVAVDPPGALIEGKPSAVVVFASCRRASSAASLGCPSQGSIASGLSGRAEAEVLATFHALR
jgi:hypothetical protein